jgi:hypothetical protein
MDRGRLALQPLRSRAGSTRGNNREIKINHLTGKQLKAALTGAVSDGPSA